MYCVISDHLTYIQNPTIPAFKLKQYYKLFLNQDVYILPAKFPKSFQDEFFQFSNNTYHTTMYDVTNAYLKWARIKSYDYYQSWVHYFQNKTYTKESFEHPEASPDPPGPPQFQEFTSVNADLPLFLHKQLSPTIYEDVKQAIHKEVSSKTIQDTTYPNEYYLIHFQNSSFILADPNTSQYLKQLSQHGIDVQITYMNSIPSTLTLPSSKSYQDLLYRTLKFTQPTNHKSWQIKKVIDLICGHYITDFSSNISVSDLYCDFIDSHDRRFINVDTFVEILKYCGYHIKDNHIQYIKKQKQEDYKPLSKPTDDAFLHHKIMNRYLQLRAEPIINFDKQVSPWNLSSV